MAMVKSRLEMKALHEKEEILRQQEMASTPTLSHELDERIPTTYQRYETATEQRIREETLREIDELLKGTRPSAQKRQFHFPMPPIPRNKR
jgi:hypothetical protein